MKKAVTVVGCLLALVLAFGLAGCGGGTDTTGTTVPTSEVTATTVNTADLFTADGRYPKETIKIGIPTFQADSDQFLEIQKYYDYLKTKLNIEVIYSESLGTDAAGEAAFIESCAAAGCKVIVAYFNIARDASIQLCIDKGMYYFGVAEEPAVYEAFKDNPYWLGGWYNATGDYDAGQAWANALIAAGCKKIVYSSGGRDYGVQMFKDRSAGFYAAIDAAKAAGKQIETVDVPSWPPVATYVTGQTEAIQNGFDGLACSFGMVTWLQPLADAGMSDTVKIASSDAFTDVSKQAWANGQVANMTIEITSMFGMAVPFIINVLDGNEDVVRDNGQAPRVETSRWVINSAEDYNTLSDIEAGGIWCWNADDILSVVKALHPEVTYADVQALYKANSIADIQARRAAQK